VAIPGRQVELTRRAHYNDATMWRPVYAVTAFALALSSVSGRTALRSAGSAAQSNLHPTAQLLAELIRIDTSNPPGHELRVAEFLAPKFAALGFQTEIVPTPEPGKAALFARLKGDGSRKPILLAAHADVVGVEREKWTVDPFAGIVRDGKVIGRGAIDFKGGMAVFARAVMMLAENRVPLSRDVIFLAEPDEESATYNTTWLAERQWPKMECEFALNEGGWIIKSEDGRVKYVSISTADKSTVLVLRSSSRPALGSSCAPSQRPTQRRYLDTSRRWQTARIPPRSHARMQKSAKIRCCTRSSGTRWRPCC
jgi:Peptidase family M20/M25/M40